MVFTSSKASSALSSLVAMFMFVHYTEYVLEVVEFA